MPVSGNERKYLAGELPSMESKFLEAWRRIAFASACSSVREEPSAETGWRLLRRRGEANPPDIVPFGVAEWAIGEGCGITLVPEVGEEERAAGPTKSVAMGVVAEGPERAAGGLGGTIATERELRKVSQTPSPCLALVREQKREYAKHALRPRPWLTARASPAQGLPADAPETGHPLVGLWVCMHPLTAL